MRVFLIGDAVACASPIRRCRTATYHLDRMLASALRHGAEVGLCGTCMEARAIAAGALVEGAHGSSLEELTDWTLWADRVVTFWPARTLVTR